MKNTALQQAIEKLEASRIKQVSFFFPLTIDEITQNAILDRHIQALQSLLPIEKESIEEAVKYGIAKSQEMSNSLPVEEVKEACKQYFTKTYVE